MSTVTELGFVDIHTHILPGVDDGAKGMPEARKLVRMAWEDGTRALVLTPHYRGVYKKNTPAWLRENLELLREMLREDLPDMALYLGNEISYEMDAPERLEEGRALPMNGGQYVLLEFQPGAFRSTVISGVSEMLNGGYVPIIAHAERYDIFRKSHSLADEVLDMGALIQLNADSVMGAHGFGVKQYCHWLLREGKAHFIASDAHDPVRRPPLLAECYRKVCKKYGQPYGDDLFRNNALRMLADETI